MRQPMQWVRGSIYRALLLAFIAVSVVPIVLISYLFIRQSMDALTRQTEENLQLLAASKAEEINLKLGDVMHSTVVAAHLAAEALQRAPDPALAAQQLSRYQQDDRAIWGLDVYYNGQGGEAALGTDLSNVYWTGPLTADDVAAQQILQTESLDTVFAGIKSISPDTQWIYLTTPTGMMRLYPWASNDHYPDQWDPRQIIFYTVAEPANNPTLEPRWTAPYVDYAGAGWMVTMSVPVLSQNGDFLGIMSHDITIESLKQIALGINILNGGGYGFLIDPDGQVIAHPAYQEVDASKGTEEDASLLTVGSDAYRRLIQNMVSGESGLDYYDEAGGSSLLVYAPIPETGWSLGISLPRETVIAPAIAMRNRAIIITVTLITTAVIFAVVLSRLIHKPVRQLLQGVQQIAEDRRADEVHVRSFEEFDQLAQAFNEMAAKVWERERQLKAKVAEMRIEIDSQRRQQQIDSIVETDFFKRLEANARQLRSQIKGLPAATD